MAKILPPDLFEMKARGLEGWQPGDYFHSARPRTAYLVHGIQGHAPQGRMLYNRTLIVSRLPPGEIPAGATVHAWAWDKRGKKKWTP